MQGVSIARSDTCTTIPEPFAEPSGVKATRNQRDVHGIYTTYEVVRNLSMVPGVWIEEVR
jgi:hypothetical protein